MIQNIREEGHEHIGTGQAADVLDELANQHHHHIGREQPADDAAQGIEDEAHGRHVPLSELLGQGPHGEDADAHGDASDDRQKGLGDAVIIGAQHIIAEIRQADILDGAAQGIDQEVHIDDRHVLITKHRLQLLQEGDMLRILLLTLQGDALLGEEILHQGQGQRDHGKDAHGGDPFALIHAQHRHDHHGEYQSHQDAAHHDRRDLVEHGKAATVGGVAGGQGHHQIMAHVENGIGKGIEEVIRQHDPDDLDHLGGLRHREEQDAGDRHQRRGQQEPGTGLALPGPGAVDDLAHDHIGDGIDDLGHDGEDHQEGAAPKAAKLQDVRIVDVQICGQHRVQQQRAGRSQQIAKPTFFTADLIRGHKARKILSVKELFFHSVSSNIWF